MIYVFYMGYGNANIYHADSESDAKKTANQMKKIPSITHVEIVKLMDKEWHIAQDWLFHGKSPSRFKTKN